MDPVSKSRVAANKERSLANLRPYPKGVSGNPAGRPKRTPLTAIYEEVFDDPQVREAVKSQIIKTMSSPGMAGVLERREAGERVEGKVAAVVDMNLSGTIQLASVIEERRKKRAGDSRES